MRLEIENAEAGKTQRTYARLAGILFLGVILIALVGGSILSRVAGDGTFAERAARIAASERLYRVALSTVLIATLSSTLLAFAFYATLRPANRLLAQLAMIFSLNDSFLALIVRMCGFARMHLYISAQTSGTDAHDWGYHGEPRWYLFWHRLSPVLLLVFQVAVYPEVPISAWHLCIGDLDRTVSCQADIPRIPRIVPVHLFPADGPG